MILTKRIPVAAICSLAASQFDVLLLEFGSGAQEERARLLTKARQVVQGCTQLLAAMTDPANDKIFNAKLGKLLHLPHAQSSSTPEPSTSTVTGKKRKSRGGANAKPKPKKAAKMKAAPKKKSEKDPIAEDEEDEEIEDEEDDEEENLSEDSVGSDD